MKTKFKKMLGEFFQKSSSISIADSNTTPIEAIENCDELSCNKSLHGLAWRHFDLFGDVSFHFHDARRWNVVFSHQKLTKYM